MKTIILNWYGPYNDETLKTEPDFGYGLYLIAGMKKGQKYDRIQYCGITEREYCKRFYQHAKKEIVTRNREYWLSEVVYPSRIKRDALEIAEKIIIFFWEPPLNDRKKIRPPEPTTIINMWFKRDGRPRINQKAIYADLPDVISWDGDKWRTGNLDVYDG
mgnify:CR=1 FL=1